MKLLQRCKTGRQSTFLSAEGLVTYAPSTKFFFFRNASYSAQDARLIFRGDRVRDAFPKSNFCTSHLMQSTAIALVSEMYFQATQDLREDEQRDSQ